MLLQWWRPETSEDLISAGGLLFIELSCQPLITKNRDWTCSALCQWSCTARTSHTDTHTHTSVLSLQKSLLTVCCYASMEPGHADTCFVLDVTVGRGGMKIYHKMQDFLQNCQPSNQDFTTWRTEHAHLYLKSSQEEHPLSEMTCDWPKFLKPENNKEEEQKSGVSLRPLEIRLAERLWCSFCPQIHFVPKKQVVKTTFSSVISFSDCLGFFSDLSVDNVTMCLDLSHHVGEYSIIISVYKAED